MDTPLPSGDSDVDAGIAALMSQLPKPIQDFLSGPKLNQIVLELSQKYALHTDHAGIFQSSLVLLLLGVNKPDDFVSTLKRAGVNSEVVQNLIVDVNNKIFIPLRKAEQETLKTAPPKPVPPPPAYTPPAPPKVEVAPQPVPAPIIPVAPPQPTMRTMVTDAEQMKAGTMPSAVPYTMPTAPTSVPTVTIVPPVPQVMQAPAAPAASKPPVAPLQKMPPTITPNTAVPPRTQTPNMQEMENTLKKYGIDPYREPVE